MRTAVLSLTAVLVLSGCAGTDPDTDTVAAPSSAPTAATTPDADPTVAPEPSPTPEGTVVDITFAGGEVTGVGPRVEVPLGEPVTVRLTSDVTEEIHIHGYDLYVDVPAGASGETTFTADIPGAFEVELHGSGKPLFQLRVA